MKPDDLSGKRYGKWTVLRRGQNYVSPSGKSKHIMWICVCDCSPTVEISVYGGSLKSGDSTGCGCERLKNNRNPNNTETHKQCYKCHEIKSMSEFATSTTGSFGKTNICKPCLREKNIALHRRDPRIRMLSDAKKRAKRDNVPITISKEDIVIPEKCPILEIQLTIGDGSPIPSSPSLDRIAPSLGYTKSNIVVLSHKANAMKQDATKEELILFAKNIMSLFIK